MDMQLVTQSQYAAMRSVSKQYINKQVRLGKIPVHENKRILVSEADAALKRHADPARQLAKPAPSPMAASPVEAADDQKGFQHWRTERERVQSSLAQMQLEELEGKLVRRDDVTREVFKSFRDLRDKLMQLPLQIAQQLVVMTNEREISSLIETRLAQVLQDFAAGIDAAPSAVS